MDNQYNQTEVAYETKPKETTKHRGMPSGDAQFGKHKMPQDSKMASKSYVKEKIEDHVMKMHHGRHREHR